MVFHSVTLHSIFLFIRTLHQLKPFIGNHFKISTTSPTAFKIIDCSHKQHETFQHAWSSLTRFLGNFLKDHSSYNCFMSNTHNYGWF
ncbi:hypothetical protein JHK85_000740 [Glycine max]|uniref:Uncharacterized protein n=2 Tax=Glycine subgen. Soja TaxID=1462606 RepID=A0A0R0LDI8_SOYBN|nr:hypothetical protein JHK85_000740 [Glycine max]KAG5088109.1 hypothetical protein JHK86_000721 [Glycine max]KAH1161966.1 hypothetical protein GYH30_000723 [Glycine max]RZC28827.1 hypothetical protein D0Y65_000701 [Glycine soja]